MRYCFAVDWRVLRSAPQVNFNFLMNKPMSAGDLYGASLVGDLARVRYHLDAGVNPNYQHPEVLCTPLVASLIHGHDAVAQCLLDHGANPGLRSGFDGLTPLQAARRYGRTALEDVLLDRGATEEPYLPFWRRWLSAANPA